MSNTQQFTATLPLLLSTKPVAGSPELPGIDSPESLLLTMARMTGAHFAAHDFPIDALHTILLRIEGLAVDMQYKSEPDCCHSQALGRGAWAIEGLASEAQTLCRMWGRHGTVKPE